MKHDPTYTCDDCGTVTFVGHLCEKCQHKAGDNVVSLAEVRMAPVATVVEECEKLLERAKAGTLRGLAVATVSTQGFTGTGFVGEGGTRDGMIAATVRLLRRLDVED